MATIHGPEQRLYKREADGGGGRMAMIQKLETDSTKKQGAAWQHGDNTDGGTKKQTGRW